MKKELYLNTLKIAFLSVPIVLIGCATEPPKPAPSGKIVISDGPSASSRPAPSKAASTSSQEPSQNLHPFKTFAVYTDQAPGRTHYVPSGYMCDNDLNLSGAFTQTPHGNGTCLRVNYHATGPKGWAGIYWQDPANNWGDTPGRAGYDLRGATKLTFWARGANGGERVHEFRMGGIVGQHPDSDVANITNVRLTKEWKQYTIDLSKKDLRHIIGGFGLFMNKAENSGGATYYLDDIVYEGAEGVVLSTPTVTVPLEGRLPSGPTVQVSAPVVPQATKDLTIKEVDSGLKVSFSSRLMFSSGRAVLEPTSGRVLDQLIGLLSAYPTNRVLIEGHTDNTGDKQFNLRLSELRAQAVRDYLVKQGGYDESRFQVVGYGDTKPIGDNTTKAGRSLNRRVEVTILKGAKP
jgi:outer membrane protein OmpA-like peptidoglycan-associated protein